MDKRKLLVVLVFSLLVLSFARFNIPTVKASAASELLIDSYTEGNFSGAWPTMDHHPSDSGDMSAHGQCFTVGFADTVLTKVFFYLRKTGSPTGNAHAVLYAMTGVYGVHGTPTGSALATSDDFDISILLTGAYLLFPFTFSGAEQYRMQANTHYCIVYENPASGTINTTNYVKVAADVSYSAHDGNGVWYENGVWDARPMDDLIFYVYGFYQFEINGLFDESSGLLMSPSERAVNVTAYYIDETSASFEVNGTYLYNTSVIPLYLHFDLGSYDREYWIGPEEGSGTIYIFTATLTAYTISFLDLAGVLNDYPYVEAQRLINGSLMTVEKRKVDVENKIVMSLVNGVKYTITLRDGASHTFGDLLMTSQTTIQLTLKGISFPKETLLTYKYVRIYGSRVFDSPNGTITITYQDTLSMTASVKIYIKYKNGTTVYSATETTNSFNHEWSNALNNTDYVVACTINHTRYGVYSWKQYFPQHLSSMPWSLDWLGKSLPFNTAYIIPALLIVFVGGCFGAINAEVGAFMMVIVAIIIAYMGWLPIPAAALVTAFTFAMLMVIIYAKRRVQT